MVNKQAIVKMIRFPVDVFRVPGWLDQCRSTGEQYFQLIVIKAKKQRAWHRHHNAVIRWEWKFTEAGVRQGI